MRKAACFGWLLCLVLATARAGLAQGLQISVGGDDCGALPGPPFCLGGTYTDTGTTVGTNNTVGMVNAGCLPQTAVSGVDVIYSIQSVTAFSTPDFDIRVTPAPGYDVAIYLVGPGAATCPAGPNATTANCVAGANAGGPGVTEIISHSALVGLSLGQYFLFIDSAAVGAASSGSYTLSVGPGFCPVELMEYSID